MAFSRFFFFVLSTGLLAGCATYQPKDLNPAATQTQLERRSLKDDGLRRFLAAHGEPSSEEWNLARLTLAAFYFSPELDLARAQLAEAGADVRTAGARPNPTFNYTPGFNQDATGGVTPWILGYALDIPVDLGGRRAHRTAEARQQAEAARLNLASAAWSVRSAVHQALTELHAADETATLWREQKPLFAQAVQLIQLHVQASEASPFEAAQTRLALNRAELAARESERAVLIARSRLAETLGVPLVALNDVRLSYGSLAAPVELLSPAEARRWAAQNRADLLAALAVYAASQSALQSEIARQYPDFSIGPGYQLDQGEGKWSLSLGLTLPLFNHNQGPIAAAEAHRESAAAKFLSLQNHILAEVDRAMADTASALGDLDTVKAMRATLEQQAKLVRAQQAAGETSRLELARAQLELAEHTRAELEARLRVERSLAAFEDVVQRPLVVPESAWRITSRPASE